MVAHSPLKYLRVYIMHIVYSILYIPARIRLEYTKLTNHKRKDHLELPWYASLGRPRSKVRGLATRYWLAWPLIPDPCTSLLRTLLTAVSHNMNGGSLVWVWELASRCWVSPSQRHAQYILAFLSMISWTITTLRQGQVILIVVNVLMVLKALFTPFYLWYMDIYFRMFNCL